MNNPSKKKRRLDVALVERGDFDSRARAQAAIKASMVTVDGNVETKPSRSIPESAQIKVIGAAHSYVSRGGLKLEAALDAFNIDPSGKVCLDLGASTGGFSDVLCRHGAEKIYAVDVGRGQLHADLLHNPRIINLEKTHARDLSVALISDPIDLIVCDVSFISLKKALPVPMALGRPSAHLIALVKPQFEVGQENIGKGGIVRPGRENAEGVAEDIAQWVNARQGWRFLEFVESPITGGDGNREFLLAASRQK